MKKSQRARFKFQKGKKIKDNSNVKTIMWKGKDKIKNLVMWI